MYFLFFYKDVHDIKHNSSSLTNVMPWVPVETSPGALKVSWTTKQMQRSGKWCGGGAWSVKLGWLLKKVNRCRLCIAEKVPWFSFLRCRAKPDCVAWEWKSTEDTCSTVTSAPHKVPDPDYVAGSRDCGGYLADQAWITCTLENPTTNVTSSKKTQLAIPDALNHPLQCIEACRGARDDNNNRFTNSIFSDNPRECWCAKNMALQRPYLSRADCDYYKDWWQTFMVIAQCTKN